MIFKDERPIGARLPRVVGISGNITRPSRTRLVIEHVLAGLEDSGFYDTQTFDILDAGPALGTTVSRDQAPPELARIWSAIEQCDALVVGSPVYKASYSGMFKHLFDLVDKDALRGRPVLLVATGRIGDFSLLLDTQLRPLFSFFRALTLPDGVFAVETDFVSPTELTPAFKERLEDSVASFRAVFDPLHSAGMR